MVKTITFDEYLLAKNNNVEKSLTETFNLAWKSSEEGIKYYKRRNMVIKVAGITAIGVVSYLSFSNSLAVTALADIVGLQILKINQPNSYEKVQKSVQAYKECLDIVGIQSDKNMLFEILKGTLNKIEFDRFVEAAKGLSFEELEKVLKLLT